jgi:1-phosphofructokinase
MILSQLGCESAAMGFLAGFSGEYVRDVLRRHRITTNFVHVPGETRTNVYIVDEIGHIETGIAELGPYIPEDALGRLVTNFDRMLHRAHLVSIGGSLPPGVPQDFYRNSSETRKQGNSHVHRRGGCPAHGGARSRADRCQDRSPIHGPCGGYPPDFHRQSDRDRVKVHDQGVEYAVTSYRSYGDVFFTPGGIYLAALDRRDFVSMFGAGDALMAGLVVAYDERMSAEEVCALQHGLRLRGFPARGKRGSEQGGRGGSHGQDRSGKAFLTCLSGRERHEEGHHADRRCDGSGSHRYRTGFSVSEAIEVLSRHRLTGVPVVDEEGHVLGFISEKDIIKAALPGYFEYLQDSSFIPDFDQFQARLRRISREPVQRFMVKKVATFKEEDSDFSVAMTLIQQNIKRAPVLREGVLVGVANRADLLERLMADGTGK